MTDKSPTREHEVRREAQEFPLESRLELSLTQFYRLIHDHPQGQDTAGFYYNGNVGRTAHIVFPTDKDRTLFLLRYSDYL